MLVVAAASPLFSAVFGRCTKGGRSRLLSENEIKFTVQRIVRPNRCRREAEDRAHHHRQGIARPQGLVVQRDLAEVIREPRRYASPHADRHPRVVSRCRSMV